MVFLARTDRATDRAKWINDLGTHHERARAHPSRAGLEPTENSATKLSSCTELDELERYSTRLEYLSHGLFYSCVEKHHAKLPWPLGTGYFGVAHTFWKHYFLSFKLIVSNALDQANSSYSTRKCPPRANGSWCMHHCMSMWEENKCLERNAYSIYRSGSCSLAPRQR